MKEGEGNRKTTFRKLKYLVKRKRERIGNGAQERQGVWLSDERGREIIEERSKRENKVKINPNILFLLFHQLV